VKRPVPLHILTEAIGVATAGRQEILRSMATTMAVPRFPAKASCPVAATIPVKMAHRGVIVGTGGSTVRGITEQTGATVTLKDDGTCSILAGSQQALDETIRLIQDVVKKADDAHHSRRQGGGGSGGGRGQGSHRGGGDRRDEGRRSARPGGSLKEGKRQQRPASSDRPARQTGRGGKGGAGESEGAGWSRSSNWD